MNKKSIENIKVFINIVSILLLIIQIISFFIASSQVTVFLGALVILCSTINVTLDTLAKSKSETTDENN